DLGPALGVGAEDQPARCLFWRRLDDGRCLAVAAYPSRAVDAAGRSGFLERRVLAWRPEPGTSIVQAMGALLELAAEQMADARLATAPGAWLRPDFRLTLAAGTVAVSPAELERHGEEGRRWLGEHLGEEGLAEVYARLLAGRRPAVLRCQRPLPAPALAALLLPLPRSEAEALSLAGWVPSSRVGAGGLAAHWDLVAGRVAATAFEPSAEELATARRWARALVRGQPPGLEAASAEPEVAFLGEVTEPAQLPEPGAETEGLPPWIRSIRAFVEDPGARWLDPAETARALSLDATVAPILAAWREEVVASLPEGADTWQWAVKTDLLAALLVAVAPASSEAGQAVFESGRVPPLLFVGRLSGKHLEPWHREATERRVERWQEQSRSVEVAPNFHRAYRTERW
ncbi:MAG: hypothetical protein MI919_35980, partial [Holophagales bacterium]|nr:hypothetical protein [Holophagales bacterium]